MRRKIYDPSHHRLLYIDKKASKKFWDEKWKSEATKIFANPPRHGWTMRITRHYLAVGSRILEGGCGLGDIVYALHNTGYEVEGIDYAPKVVKAINKNWPELRVTEGDVRNLSFDDGFFDGYWSIGVIEHFPDGYGQIANEMRRVLRPDGYLFLSFPSFNPFRQARAADGKYNLISKESSAIDDFFQYALNPSEVQEHFEHIGFKLVDSRGIGALQCLEEDTLFAAGVQRFINRFPSRVGTAISMVMDLIIGHYAGHSCLLILQKK